MIDLIKFDRPEQFPKDQILNEDDRLVRSWASVEVRDKQGDIVPIEEVRRTLNTWFKRGATMIDQHSNRPIGRGLNWKEEVHEASGKPGILLDYQVFDDYSADHQVWDDIKAGKRTGLSIGGRALGKPEMKMDDYTGQPGNKLNQLELYEISPVDKPANQLSENTHVNYMAKGEKGQSPEEFEKKLVEDLKKGFEGDPNKPYAGFNDMKGCVDAQMKRGHSDDSAKRVCSFLSHRSNNKFEKGGFEIIKDSWIEKTKTDVQKPFAGYDDFNACVKANQDADNPEAYCASIHHQATGKWPTEKKKSDGWPEGFIKELNKADPKTQWDPEFIKDIQKNKEEIKT